MPIQLKERKRTFENAMEKMLVSNKQLQNVQK